MFGLSSHDVGRPLRDLEISYRPVELRSLIERAYSERRVVRVSGVERLLGSDEVQFVDLHVQPLWDGDGLSAGVMVIFSDSTVATRLQREVKRNREELETAYEELQSTNEELETTNEELQSGNEELETMNEEMRARTTELDEARNFLEGVLSSVAAAVVVLDSELLVRSWNRGASDLSGLRSEEVRDRGFLTLDFGPDRGRPRRRPAVPGDRRSGRTGGGRGDQPDRTDDHLLGELLATRRTERRLGAADRRGQPRLAVGLAILRLDLFVGESAVDDLLGNRVESMAVAPSVVTEELERLVRRDLAPRRHDALRLLDDHAAVKCPLQLLDPALALPIGALMTQADGSDLSQNGDQADRQVVRGPRARIEHADRTEQLSATAHRIGADRGEAGLSSGRPESGPSAVDGVKRLVP